MESLLFYRSLGLIWLVCGLINFAQSSIFRKSYHYQKIYLQVGWFSLIGTSLLAIGFLLAPPSFFKRPLFNLFMPITGFLFLYIIFFFFACGLALLALYTVWKERQFWRKECDGLSEEEKKMKLYEPYTLEEIKFREKLKKFFTILGLFFVLVWFIYMKIILH